jgi:hypothetical protein
VRKAGAKNRLSGVKTSAVRKSQSR